MHAGGTDLHPDFGPPSYGIPYDVVGGGHAKASIDFAYASEAIPARTRSGPDITVEGGSDRHALMIDRATARSTSSSPPVERRRTRRRGAARSSTWARTPCARAAGRAPTPRDCSIFAGLAAVGRGRRRARSTTRSGSRSTAPRGRSCGRRGTRRGPSDGRCPPMGARFRLKRGFSLAGFSDDAKVILRGDEALRPDRRRQRQRLVLPGHASTRAGRTRCSTS